MKKRTWFWVFALTLLTTVSLGFIKPADAQAVSFRIVALGASNTYGKGVSETEAYPAQLEQLLKKQGFSVQVENAGINGDTTGDMLARLERDVPTGTELVILQPGGNDRRQGMEHERATNIARIKQRLAARGIPVLMMENDMLRTTGHRAEDGQHFTPQGYALLAQRLLPQVRATLTH